MLAQEYRSKRTTLGRGFQGEPLRQRGAILIVISDLEPWQAAPVDGGFQQHAADPQHPSVLQSQRFLELVIGINQQGLTAVAAPRGDIVFGATIAAHLEAKTKVTLLFISARIRATLVISARILALLAFACCG